MKSDAQEADREFREFVRRLLMLQILSIPGALLLVFGLFGYFSENPGLLHPLLGDVNMVMLMLGAGALIILIESGMTVRLISRRARRQRARASA